MLSDYFDTLVICTTRNSIFTSSVSAAQACPVIAEVLLNLGFKVSGSDLYLSETCRYLSKKGAQIQEGHSERNLPASASLVVYSSAVNEKNPEVMEARRRGIPVIPRAEVLAELMRLKYGVAVAGSHGKTTTTSMVATILETAKLDPTVIIGGRVKSMGSGGKLGQGEFLVAESDESDRSFLLLEAHHCNHYEY